MKRRKRIVVAPGAPDLRVEQRQTRLQANSEAIERWQRRLFRAATELQKLVAQRKRLLNPPRRELKYLGAEPTGIGGGNVDAGLNDDIPF